ncbi:hypothetical protein [Streptomyces griseus]|uniref:hypothetical protein n=1 Tax=Streptomyces griseus TaxID=1911 RepID=UPI00055A01EB|nr:hypothetical protein [Streptomyces griseus]
MRRTALAALCLTAVTAAGLTGCLPGQDKADDKANNSGTSGRPVGAAQSSKQKEPFAGLSADDIAERAFKATNGASSLRFKGDVPDDETKGTIQIDLALNKKGECAGTMSMNGQGKADLLKAGDTLYMKYDEAFLRAQSEGDSKADTDAVVAMLAGKWTKMSATGADAKDIAGFCDLDSVLEGPADVGSDSTEDSNPDATVSRGKTTTVDGTPAVVLNARDGKDRYTLYVASEGEPYLLRMDSTSADEPGTITFTDYEKPVPAQKPTGEVVDLDALAG